MFVDFFHALRAIKVPVTLKEYLVLLEGMQKHVAFLSVEDFYYLSRTTLVKDEKHLDKFDRAFSQIFRGVIGLEADEKVAIPEEWLAALGRKFLTEEEKAQIEAMGGFEKLMETLKQRLEEQKGRHEGGNKWVGTKGTSPFGNSGYNPEGVRIGGESMHKRAVKVWEKREFKNLDDSIELGTRNIKVALRRLRRWAREGAPTELDLPDTIRATAHQGYLDLVLRPERHNKVKVLLFLDIGGSMDPHIKVCEELFSAARAEFKHLEHYYFHNCLYEYVWKDNRRRQAEKIPTFEVLHKYPSDYKVVFVGDATMSPYEVTHSSGSVEHWNEDPGGVWLERALNIYEHAVWLNPLAEQEWDFNASVKIIQQIFANRMFPLTLQGLERGMKELNRA
jgi:uncharacterized protein with von Willebrand factor type A (vWA) domain